MNNTKIKPTTQPTSTSQLFRSFKELRTLEIPATEFVIYGLSRGEVGMLQSVTNVGKTTLMLNMAICLAVGRPFLNLVREGEPRRIMYIDYETPISRFRDDLLQMLEALNPNEIDLFDSNFFSYCLCDPTGDEVRLSDPGGHGRMLQAIEIFKPELIIVDTVSQAFPEVIENDNTEVMKRLVVPLGQLARKGNSAILFAHHIGKEKSEEGKTHNNIHRSRGGSVYASASRLILQLDQRQDNGVSGTWLSYVKAKCETPGETKLILDVEARWFTGEGESPVKSDDRIEKIFGGWAPGSVIKSKDLREQAKGMGISDATYDRLLAKALEWGDVVSPNRGMYQKV